MPVAVTTISAPAAVPPAGPGQTPPAPGFAEALAAQTDTQATSTSTPGRLPTVSLGTMVASLAGTPVDLDPTPFGASAAGAAESVSSASTPSGLLPDGAGNAVLEAGERYLGVPYLWGGTSARTGFDCSGFVQQVFADLGVSLPRVSADQSRVGTEVGGLQNAQPGDLLFWRGTGGRPNHIAIYAGNGQMLDAPRTGQVIGYRDVRSAPPDSVRRVSLPG